ncbi:MAG TPA: class I SAM-dependent methyltransferase [Verrucomicrobiae bacterium]|nr:class I SAM-dependent methyltransferase [Verrucomicrobiae bacterium]
MKHVEAQADKVDGWLHPKEGRILYQLANRCTGRGRIVEIGSWKGKSTIWMSFGSREGCGAKVHAIDPHTGSPEHSTMFGGKVWTFEEFQRNIDNAGVSEMIVPHVDYSTSVAKTFNDPVEFIFIDGLHEYEGVRDDFEAWYPKVVNGGTIAFHDSTCWPGVYRLVIERVFKSRHFRKVRFSRSIVYGEKVAQNTFMERLENQVFLLAFRLEACWQRWTWRLLHNYLDSEFTRAAIAWYKRKRTSAPPAAVSTTSIAAANTSAKTVVQPPIQTA